MEEESSQHPLLNENQIDSEFNEARQNFLCEVEKLFNRYLDLKSTKTLFDDVTFPEFDRRMFVRNSALVIWNDFHYDTTTVKEIVDSLELLKMEYSLKTQESLFYEYLSAELTSIRCRIARKG